LRAWHVSANTEVWRERIIKDGPDIALVAALIGDPARANILTALMAGKALTATELAAEAGVTPQTTSGHLSKLEQSGLVLMRKQGRHRYFALTGDDVAQVLEGLMGLAARSGHLRARPGLKNASLRKARVCYNHLAGEAGTTLYETLVAAGHIDTTDAGPDLTDSGTAVMSGLGIDVTRLRAARAPLCKECLDWSERRSHLAGSLGRAFLSRIEELGWATRDRRTRIVAFSPGGMRSFDDFLLKLTA